MNKKVVVGIAAVVLLAGGFLGGAALGPRVSFLSSLTGAGAGRGVGEPGGNLTAAEQAQLQNMTDSERQAFMQKKMGSAAPGGAAGGQPGGAGGISTVEGEVIEAADGTLNIKTTSGGSQTVYIDDSTTLAYATDAKTDGVDVGDTVIALAAPEGDVLAASAVIIK